MGRKIPGRKHKKIKDPSVQQSRRTAELKNKINNPPKKEDFQEIPKSVLRIMELKEKAKQITQKRKMMNKTKRLPKLKKIEKEKASNVFDFKKALGKEFKMPGMDQPDRYIPQLEMEEDESSDHFIKRVENVCKDLVKEIKFEEEFNVEVLRNEKGVITEVKRGKSQKISKKPKLVDKRRERENKKVNQKEPIRDFEKRDTFEFGDIVHEPPKTLTIPGPKRKNEGDGLTPKPGKKDLLLKSVLGKTDKNSNKLTKFEKEKREERRKLVVEAFRKSKKDKFIKSDV